MLDIIIARPLRYWKWLPGGLHVSQVLKEATEISGHVAEIACVEVYDFVSSASIAEIRDSLSDVAYAEKAEILKNLGEIERKCSKNR